MLVLGHSIAIGICTHNDEKTLPILLSSLLHIAKKAKKQDYFNIHELIVVSSGSTDRTNEIIESYRCSFQQFLSYRPQYQYEREGKASAINLILSENTSNYLIFIPADVDVCYDSLSRLIYKISKNLHFGAVSGRPVPNTKSISNKNLKTALNFIWNLHNETLKELTEKGTNSHSSGELMIIRSGVVQSIPGDIINDDAYIAVKIKSEGYMVSYEPRSEVSIEVPLTIFDYIVQRKRVLIGHKQLSNTGKTPSNFRRILKTNPLIGLKLLYRSINNIEDLIGFINAILLEMRVELSIRASKTNTDRLTKEMIIWSRINQTQPSQD